MPRFAQLRFQRGDLRIHVGENGCDGSLFCAGWTVQLAAEEVRLGNVQKAVGSSSFICYGCEARIQEPRFEIMLEKTRVCVSIRFQLEANVQDRNQTLVVFREPLDCPEWIPVGVAAVVGEVTCLNEVVVFEHLRGYAFLKKLFLPHKPKLC